MKKFFMQLRPLERRVAVGVIVLVLFALNWMFVVPYFSEWGNLTRRKATAEQRMETWKKAIAEAPNYEKQVKSMQGQGEFVALEDQAINFIRTIQSQAAASGVSIANYSRATMRADDAFFVEQVQNINVIATDEQLVDFLYKLGSGSSMVRVRDLDLQPDGPHLHLNGNIRLVASYQKNPPASAKPAPAKAK